MKASLCLSVAIISIFFYNNVFAVGIINPENPEELLVCSPGCIEWRPAPGEENLPCPWVNFTCTGGGCYKQQVPGESQATGKCYNCYAGHYSDLQEAGPSCDGVCHAPVGAELVTTEEQITDADTSYCPLSPGCQLTGHKSEYGCPWIFTCAIGEYYSGSGNQCTPCGDGYKGVGEWTFVGNGDNIQNAYDNAKQNGGKKDLCEGIEYSISLNTNNPYDYLPSYGGKDYKNYDITFKFGTGLIKGHSSATKLASGSLQPSAPYYVFNGYYTASEGGDQVFTANGSLVDTNLEAELWLTATDLYAQYTINDFHIWYEKTMPGSALSRTADATYDVTNSSRLAKSYNPDWFEDGELITGYICVLNDGTGTDCGRYQPGDNITFPENVQQMGRVLYAQTEICPAGHYCYDNKTYDCPGGSTSDEGSGSISDCYMSAETYFIDGKGGKFTLGDLLGDNAKIYRH